MFLKRSSIQKLVMVLSVVALLVVPMVGVVSAADQPSGITVPADGATVDGVVVVKGYADTNDFSKWVLELLPAGNADNHIYLASGTTPGAVEYSFDTTPFPAGEHALRLRAVKKDGNYDEFTSKFTIGAPIATAVQATTATAATAATTATQAAPAPAAKPFKAPAGALVAVRSPMAPVLDGAVDPAWVKVPAITIPVVGGANTPSTKVNLKSVWNGDNVYFLASWADPTESFIRSPWEKQADGTWKVVKDPKDKGGDNNLVYEDKMAMIWNIAESIKGFDTAGCFGTCHVGENPDKKPYGNKYTASAGELGDIWHWKSVRNLAQVDDQYVDDTRYSADTPEAGRKSDPKDSGGYVNNETADKKMPAFMPPGGGDKTGAPGYILDSEKVPFDDSLFKAGDRVPGIVKSTIVGDRGDIPAGWQWKNGVWTLEFGRKFDTGSPTDVQFDDPAKVYRFGVATFDNAQVRHSFQTGSTPFVFQP